MKQSMSATDIADELMKDEYAAWTYNGARALAEYLDNLDDETGEETEFDRVAIRCEYSQYGSAWEAMEQYQPEDMPTIDDPSESMDLVELDEAQEAEALRWLNDHTTVIEFEGGVIIADF